jgi:hypothetical protein
MKLTLHAYVKKCGVLFISGICYFLPSFSQNETSSYFEAGITVGPSNFLGDLGGNLGKGTRFLKDNNFPMTKFMFGAYLTYGASEWLAFRLALNHGTIEGDDAIIKGKGGLEEARKFRNSNFKSKITEAMILAEVYPTVFFEYEPSEIFKKLRPYAMIGVGMFKYNPQGTDPLTGEWVYLKPLRTEGQGMTQFPDRKEYKLTQMNIPMGFGAKYFLSDNVNVALEVLHRQTFTDYIDDVSTKYIDPSLFYQYMPLQQAQLAQRMANKSGNNGVSTSPYFAPGRKRGDPNNNDAYYSVNIKLGFRLGNGDRWNNSTRCPIRF